MFGDQDNGGQPVYVSRHNVLKMAVVSRPVSRILVVKVLIESPVSWMQSYTSFHNQNGLLLQNYAAKFKRVRPKSKLRCLIR